MSQPPTHTVTFTDLNRGDGPMRESCCCLLGADHNASFHDLCALHGYEPIPPGYYRVCGECHHAYATGQDLVDAHNQVVRRLWVADEESPSVLAAKPEDVPFCPLCTHDW